MGVSGNRGWWMEARMRICKCLTINNLKAYYITLSSENLITNDKGLIKKTMRNKRRDKVLWRKGFLKIWIE